MVERTAVLARGAASQGDKVEALGREVLFSCHFKGNEFMGLTHLESLGLSLAQSISLAKENDGFGAVLGSLHCCCSLIFKVNSVGKTQIHGLIWRQPLAQNSFCCYLHCSV